jgi:hypothetical protein
MSTPPRFGVQAVTAALERIAAKIGADASDAQLLRLANNAVFALPAAGLVIRITLSHRLHDRARKNAALGAWFDDVDARTIRLAKTQIPQPIEDGQLLATVWTYVPPHEPQPDGTDLGDALHAYHGLGLPPFPLPAWDPIGDARTRITDAERLSEEDRTFLLDWCDRLEPQLHEYAASTPTGLVHGDAHVGNLIRDASGVALLTDFDATCAGPPIVDLVPEPVNEECFGQQGEHRKLAHAYGYDITLNPAWPLLRDARKLKMIAAAVPLLGVNERVVAEFKLRLNSVRTNAQHRLWTPFATLTR